MLKNKNIITKFGISPFKWALLLVFALAFSRSFATHIVGGEIYYTLLNNNWDYEITLKVYRDCGPNNTQGTGFDDPASVGIFNSFGGLIYNLQMDLWSAEVDLVPVVLENPCFVLPPNLCVERVVYTQTVNLPPIAGGYDIVYQRCCRNPSITNLDFPEDTGATFTTQIPDADTYGENSCPQYTNFPPVALCQNAEFIFDHSATDEDGDSLVYTMCDPLLGADDINPMPSPPEPPPFQTVNWANGFSATYPITSNPAFAIDPVTGILTGTATQVGQYVVGICVSEYRNGQLLSVTNRDFQFNVTVCDPNIVASIPDQTNFCDGLSVEFSNNSINATFFYWDFGVEELDNDTSIEVSPEYNFPDSGIFTIMLVANPGWPCADTAYTTYEVLPVINPEITLDGFVCINDNIYYNFTSDGSTSAFATYSWDFGPGAVPQFSSDPNPQNIVLNDEVNDVTVSLTIADNGCEETDTQDINNPPEPVAVIVPQEGFCDGYTYQFENASENAVNYFWDFGTPFGADYSLEPNPEYTFSDTGHYSVMLAVSADYTCPDTTWMEFEIYGLLQPSFEPGNSQCFEGNSFDFEAQGATTNNAEFLWEFSPEASISTSSQQNPQNVSYDSSDHFGVTLTITENGCTESYTDSVWVVANPEIGFEIDNYEGCPDLYVLFNDTSWAETQLFYNWEFGDGTSSTSDDPVHPYTQPGFYDVTLTIYTVTGCIDELTLTNPNAVHVYVAPIADFLVSPSTVNILDPVVNIIDESTGSVSCLYFMGDGGSSDECNFTYSFSEGGRIEVTQYVLNEFGCADHMTQYVNVEGFLLYAPNAFTPNGDGINDFWLPSVIGSTQYDLEIYNRWGEVIFATENPDTPWIGNVHGRDHFAEDGVYLFRIVMHDLLGYPHDYLGHITLTR